MSESKSVDMPPIISAKEDTSSVLYEGRARISEMADILAMDKDKWRDRLAAAVRDSGRSKRSISLEAGLGPGYVHSLLVEGKDPTVSSLIAVCQALGVSLSHVLYGYDISAETEELLRHLEAAPHESRQAILQLLRDQTRPLPPR